MTLFAALGSAAAAQASSATLTVSAPTNTVPKTIQVQITPPGGAQQLVPVIINPLMTVQAKRNAIVAALTQAGFQAVADPDPAKCKINNLADGTKVSLVDQGTGEIQDSVQTPKAATGTASFTGTFSPFDYHNQPAIFTAGIVTDVGVLNAQISAQELNFQTDGPIICQALFQRLAPRAPQYGAQINYAGDRLEVYFDPAYTVTQGGIIFGTNSTSPGCGGTVLIPLPPPQPLPGDMNCDGMVDALDIAPFIEAMTDPARYAADYPGCNILNGDFDGDGAVTFLDLGPFVQSLAR